MKLHHIGIVVNNIQGSLGELTKFLDFKETSVPIEVKSQKVNVCFLKTSDVYIELIEPIENNSPVRKFSESGGGRGACEERREQREGISIIPMPSRLFNSFQ